MTLNIELVAMLVGQVAVFVGFMTRLEKRLTRIETIVELRRTERRLSD